MPEKEKGLYCHMNAKIWKDAVPISVTGKCTRK